MTGSLPFVAVYALSVFFVLGVVDFLLLGRNRTKAPVPVIAFLASGVVAWPLAGAVIEAFAVGGGS